MNVKLIGFLERTLMKAENFKLENLEKLSDEGKDELKHCEKETSRGWAVLRQCLVKNYRAGGKGCAVQLEE